MADCPPCVLVRHDHQLRKVPAGCIPVMMRPVPKRLSGRKLEQVPLAVPTGNERPENRPEILNVLPMFRLFRPPNRIDLHSQCAHHRLQAALRAESVQLIGIRPTVVREEQFCVLPVPALGICKIGGVHHRRAPPPLPWPRGVRDAMLEMVPPRTRFDWAMGPALIAPSPMCSMHMSGRRINVHAGTTCSGISQLLFRILMASATAFARCLAIHPYRSLLLRPAGL